MPAHAGPPRSLPVAAPWLFAAAMAVSLVVAAGGGMVLGFLAATESGFAAENWTRAVQAHGRLQLFGWAAVFVTALAFEFVPRLNQRRSLPAVPRGVVLALLLGGALLQAAGQVWDALKAIMIPGAILVLGAAAGFAAIIYRVRPPRPLSADPHPAWFRASAAWLVVAAAASLAAFARATDSVVRLDDSVAVADVMLRGFLLHAVIAVALRAFPGHLGLDPLPPRRQWAGLALINGAIALRLAGTAAFGMPGSEPLRVAGDFLLGGAVVLVTLWIGVLTVAPGMFQGPRFRLLVPAAWTGLVLFGAALAFVSPFAATESGEVFLEGSVRHLFLLGFMAPLMLAMAHIVLARFGTGRVAAENALTGGFVLVMVAWPLRVVPAFFSDAPGEAAQALMGAAAVIAAAGLLLASAACALNARAIFRATR